MVGPGTGLAPFVGFMQERHHDMTTNGLKRAPAHLFFGCRKQDCDFIYKQDILAHSLSGVLTKTHLALSREDGHPKNYVQDVMRQQSAMIIDTVKAGGYIYLCGSTKMG